MNDLRQLRHFLALAEHGHFARAAEAVNLTQPALSRSIQALEANLGCVLVDRNSRGISLTAHGQLVREHAARLLAGSRALNNAVSQLANLESGELRLGSGPYPAARLAPRAIGRLVQRYPRVRVELCIDDWRSLRDRLLDDRIELFLADIRELEGDPLLKVEPLRQYEGVIFCRPGHPLLAQAPLHLKALAAHAFAGTQVPQEVAESLQRLSGNRQLLGIQCDNFMVLKNLVAHSDVLSIAPWDVLAEDLAAGRLAILPLQQREPSQYSAYGLVSRAGHSLSPAAQELVRQVHLEEQDFRASCPAPDGVLGNG